MAFEILISSRIEDFPERFPQDFRRDIFAEDSVFMVQNNNLRQWLNLGLTRKQGVFLGLETAFPDQVQRTLMEGFYPEGLGKLPLYLDNLKLVLFEELRTIYKKERTDPRWKWIVEYLEASGGAGDERVYDFAQELAGIFHTYGMNAPQIGSLWSQGKPVESSLLGQEWQGHLWRRLFVEGEFSHVGIAIQKLLDEKRVYQGPLKEIKILGSLFLSPMALDLLYQFSQVGSVKYFFYYPQEDGYPFEKRRDTLGSWTKLLDVLVDWSVDKSITWTKVPGAEFPKKNNLQRLLSGQGGREAGGEVENALENALEFHACATKHREVEALRDRIWHFLGAHPETSLERIGVLAPDIKEYAPYLEKVFAQEGERALPFNLVDLSFGTASPFIQGFLNLLELIGTRWSKKTIFELLENPCIAQAYSLGRDELETWKLFTEKAQILWGWDTQHLKALGYQVGEAGLIGKSTWKEGFRRFLDGFARAPQPKDWFHFPQEWHRIPLESIGSGNMGSLARFFGILESWYKHLETKSLRDLTQWGDWCKELIRLALAPRKGEDGDLQAQKELESGINELFQTRKDLQDHCALESLDFPVFNKILQDKFRKMTGSRGHHMTEGITCCSIGPFRAMPFEVIALLGMDEGKFPRGAQTLSINLMDGISADWIDPKTTDLYTLWETLGSARQEWWVFYQGKNPQNESLLAPALPIEELQDLLEARFPQNPGKRVVHTLVPQDGVNFTPQCPGGLLGTSQKAYHLALAMESQSAEYKKVSNLAVAKALETGGIPETVDLKDWLRFFDKPQDFFAKSVLGIYFPYEDQDDQDGVPSRIPPFVLTEIKTQGLVLGEDDFVQGPLRWLVEEGAVGTGLDKTYWSQHFTKAQDQAAVQWESSKDWRWVHLSVGGQEGELSLPGVDWGGQRCEGDLGPFLLGENDWLYTVITRDSEDEKKVTLDFSGQWKHFWTFLAAAAHGWKGSLGVILWNNQDIKTYQWSPPTPEVQEKLMGLSLEWFALGHERPQALFSAVLEKVLKGKDPTHWPGIFNTLAGEGRYPFDQRGFLLVEKEWTLDDKILEDLVWVLTLVSTSYTEVDNHGSL